MLICVDNFRVVMCLIICCICDGYPTKKIEIISTNSGFSKWMRGEKKISVSFVLQ